jgi:type IV pilus assembly protein PilO
MENFSELSSLKQWAAVMFGGVVVTAALYFTVFKTQRDAVDQAQQALSSKLAENAELQAYMPKLKDMNQQLENLKQQMEIERHIVPDEKEVPEFIKLLDAEALKSGVEIRRYTAKAGNTKDFYTEVPFEMELDGSYYAVLDFFDRVGKLERIINISSVAMATTKKATEAKAKHSYQYGAAASVVVVCDATTFFSHDVAPPAAATKTKGAL